MSELIRIEQRCNENFKTIDLRIIENDALSWRAKGLHTYLISRPPDWKLWYKDLEQRSTDGKAAIGSAVKELQDAGYLRIERIADEKGRAAGSRWIVAQSPELMPSDVCPHPDCPDTVCPDTVCPDTGNPLHSKNHLLPSNTSSTDQESMCATPPALCKGAAYSEPFERAWANWLGLGRGVGKKAAAREWNATLRSRLNGAKPEVSAERLVRAAANFAEAMRLEGRSPDVILLASTFFGRDQRWEDYENWAPSAVPRSGREEVLGNQRATGHDPDIYARLVKGPKEEAVAGGCGA